MITFFSNKYLEYVPFMYLIRYRKQLSPVTTFLALTLEHAFDYAVDQVVQSKLELSYNLFIQGLCYRESQKSEAELDVVPMHVLLAHV